MKKNICDDSSAWPDWLKVAHTVLCEDPYCTASICRAKRKYLRVAEDVRVVSSAENVRLFFQSRLPLDRLQLAFCPGCGTEVSLTVGQQIAWERERGEPAALVCSLACANRFIAELAKGLPD
jgi:hypothetical protein